MSKTPKSSFQLKPKHLIGAFFGVCIIAVAALVIGVISTIKSHDSQEREAIKNKPVPKDTPVEVWRPIGAPEEDRTKPAAKAELDDDEKTDSRNPVIPPKNKSNGKNSNTAPTEDEASEDKPANNKANAKPAVTETPDTEEKTPRSTPAAAGNRRTLSEQPTESKPAAKPEQRQPEAAKPAPKPTPKPKAPSKSKEVIDNLF